MLSSKIVFVLSFKTIFVHSMLWTCIFLEIQWTISPYTVGWLIQDWELLKKIYLYKNSSSFEFTLLSIFSSQCILLVIWLHSLYNHLIDFILGVCEKKPKRRKACVLLYVGIILLFSTYHTQFAYFSLRFIIKSG